MIRVYPRVSSNQQSIKSQLPDLQRWVNAQSEPAQWYQDTYTGRTMNRPGWQRLYADLMPGDTLLVWRLDRLGRTASGLTALFDDLQKRGINFISVRDGIDLSTPAGRFMANVLASCAQYETEVRSERCKAGIAARKAKIARGEIIPKKPGRKKGSWEKVSPTLREVIRQQREEGKAISVIARELNLARQTVYSVLAQEDNNV